VKPFYWVLIIFSTAFILRIPAFFNPIVDGDEAWYAVSANVINHGGLIYKDAVDLKPPLLFYIYALQFSVFGNDMRLLHFNTTFWILITLKLKLLLGKKSLYGGVLRRFTIFRKHCLPQDLSLAILSSA